jgi:hypothetical protein
MLSRLQQQWGTVMVKKCEAFEQRIDTDKFEISEIRHRESHLVPPAIYVMENISRTRANRPPSFDDIRDIEDSIFLLLITPAGD